jgi:DNA processing protein
MMKTSSTCTLSSRGYQPPAHQVTLEGDSMAPSLDVPVYVAGRVALLERTRVAVIGSRSASTEGLGLAMKVAQELVGLGRIVVSGLAAGVDTAAHCAAIAAGGSTIAVIGTDLNHAYPPENAWLQQRIYQHHLLVSPFGPGTPTRRWNFPIRNRLMARLTQATVLVEAGEKSGAAYQVCEALALGCLVLVHARSAGEVSWVRALAEAGRVHVWEDVAQLRAELLPVR